MTRSVRTAKTKRPMSDERREKILQELEDLMLAEGFASLGIDDMARRLQCSKATLYAVASSREQLIIKTFERTFARRGATVGARVAKATGARERIIAYINAIQDQLEAMSRTCYEDLRAFEGTDAAYRRVAHDSAARFRKYIEQGVADGSFRPLNSQFIGVAFNRLFEGILDGTFRDQAGLSDAEAYGEITALLLRGLAPE